MSSEVRHAVGQWDQAVGQALSRREKAAFLSTLGPPFPPHCSGNQLTSFLTKWRAANNDNLSQEVVSITRDRIDSAWNAYSSPSSALPPVGRQTPPYSPHQHLRPPPLLLWSQASPRLLLLRHP